MAENTLASLKGVIDHFYVLEESECDEIDLHICVGKQFLDLFDDGTGQAVLVVRIERHAEQHTADEVANSRRRSERAVKLRNNAHDIGQLCALLHCHACFDRDDRHSNTCSAENCSRSCFTSFDMSKIWSLGDALACGRRSRRATVL